MYTINDYRKGYITVCFVTAIIYSFVVGIHLPVLVCISDGVIYGGILLAAGWLFQNIFRFAIPVSYSCKSRITFLAVLAVLTGLLFTGIESFAIFLLFPSSFDSFVPTLPLRVFVAFLIFIIGYLFFNKKIDEAKERLNDFSGKMPMDSSETGYLSTDERPDFKPPIIDRITVRIGHKIKIIPIEHIIYIKADGDYISIHTDEGKWLKEQTMNYTEDCLPAQRFVRIHRSYIVNVHQISRIERYGEKQLVVLHNNEKIKISATRYQLLRQILGI